MSKKHTKHRRHKRQRRTIKGGSFSQQLNNTDVSDNSFDTQGPINIDELNTSNIIEEDNGPMNIDELNTSNITETHDGPMNIDELDTDYTTDADDTVISDGPMNIDELNTNDMSGYTTEADETYGGKRMIKRRTRKLKRKNKNTRKKRTSKRKHRRRQRGGTCYGNGVGANSYDPNYSIYNTRELQLFPYKP